MTTSHSSYKQPWPVMGGTEGNRWDNKQSGKSTHKLGARYWEATNNWTTNNLASQPTNWEPDTGKQQTIRQQTIEQ